jgi:uncharacterized protein YndB with AHSA1/START domain
MTNPFSTSITINAAPYKIWNALTNPRLMKEWMGEPEMQIEVSTDWKVNSSIMITGFHHGKFESKGFILQYEKEKKLSYSQLDSVSQLPDKIENYTILEFILFPLDQKTHLTIHIVNFPTEVIRKHLELYWTTTIHIIKNIAEIG